LLRACVPQGVLLLRPQGDEFKHTETS